MSAECYDSEGRHFLCLLHHRIMVPRAIHPFHPFSLQHGSKRQLHMEIQEAIYYAESRFRKACIVISRAPATDVRWMQKILNLELVGFQC